MGSYKDIENLLKDVTPELLVGNGGKLTPAQRGDATYRHLQLQLLSQMAKSLDTIAFNHNQLAQSAGSTNGILKALQATYAEMLKLQTQKRTVPPAGGNGV